MRKPNTNAPAFRAAELASLITAHVHNVTGETPNPFYVARAVAMLQTSTRAAKSWSERVCNEPMSEAQATRGSKRIEKLQAECNAALDTLAGVIPRMECDLGGDPRGPCGRLKISGQRGDGWGEGFAIY